MIPPNTQVIFSNYAQGRCESIWGPDAKEFNPERWFNKEGNMKKESQYKFNVFNGGPRVCLGQNMATNEAMTVLSVLWRKYDFELATTKVEYEISVTLPMKYPLLMKITRRA